MLRRCAAGSVLFACLLSLTLSSCVVRRRIISRRGASPAQGLHVASKDALIEAVSRQYNAIQDFTATVDMVPALGSAENSKITEYKDVRGYILFRKPASIRMIGLYPVVRSKAFDMASAGASFRLYIPSKSLFITGPGEVVQPSPNKLENLRPEHFLNALIVKPVDPAVETAVLENLTDEDDANYVLLLLRQNGGQLSLSRNIWFNRSNLQIERQLIFDNAGNILTDARYSGWKSWDNVAFPKHIEINRPQDGYAVVLDVVKMDINKGVTDDKFVLEQPEGTKLRTIGQSSGTAPSAASAR
jgi:outer membrane lipoprotein-sorting protein